MFSIYRLGKILTQQGCPLKLFNLHVSMLVPFIQIVYHPKKLWYYLDNYNYDIGSDEYNADY